MNTKCEHLNADGTFKKDGREEPQRHGDTEVALRAGLANGLPIDAAGNIMFAPAGDHEIHCGLGDNASAVLTVRIDKGTEAVLNASLAKLNSQESPQRALFDFEHQGKEAMAWPVGFHWQDTPAPGVYATAEYSKMGKEYVDGKMVRAFSGSFFTDADLPKKKKDVKAGLTYAVKAGKRGSAENPARITGLDFPYAGTLTNNPAFRENQPLWAAQKRTSTSPHPSPQGGEGEDKTQKRIEAVDRAYGSKTI
jgi:hypothetical protein